MQNVKYFMKLFFVSDYSEITEDILRNSRDPWLIMDDEGLNTINKRSNSIWKKNQDADLMRMGKRSAFNDDMVISKFIYSEKVTKF